MSVVPRTGVSVTTGKMLLKGTKEKRRSGGGGIGHGKDSIVRPQCPPVVFISISEERGEGMGWPCLSISAQPESRVDPCLRWWFG